MKIVYVFNDRRPTDLLHPIVAISDDGVVAGVAHFDDWTLPFARFAMHVIDDCDAPGSDAFLIARTRAETQELFDAKFGAGKWSAVWLDDPRSDPGWIKAMELMRAEAVRREEQRRRVLDVISDTVISWLPTAEEVETIGTQENPAVHALH
ncbi:hypothetical protein KTE68_22220 [Burkholderia multivorans]|uniref:hypothetical protein n=1 Tax=Burkholderia multivorans TaxID=87883 RepID=UPI001C24F78A|nr:hypothetical protein [Burkholderia multivorans]MBU9502871.1 hypothetical protein [Burkholderia multivorans]